MTVMLSMGILCGLQNICLTLTHQKHHTQPRNGEKKKREKKSKKEKTCTNSQKPDREGWGKGGGRSDGEGGVWALCVHEEAGKTAAVRTKSHPALDKPLEFHGELGEVS